MTASTAVALAPSSRRSLPASRLDSRNNALNLFRLILATAVFISHAYSITAAGPEPRWAGESLGGWAVIGFFVISGYLITASRMRSDLGTYLVQRVARIFPAFLVCMILTAAVFAPIAYLVQNDTLSGFLTTPNTPFNYVFANAGLKITDYSVAGTLATVPYPFAWNGPLWTLYYEFLAYLVVGFAMIFAVVKRTPWIIAAMFAASVAVRANLDTLNRITGGNYEADLLSKLLPYFLGGAVVYMLRTWIPLRWWVALPSLAAGLLIAYEWNLWGGQAAAPLFAVAILWLASWVPSPQFIRTNDVSYGLYIYAWPVQQLLALRGVHEHGLLVYNLATGAGALLLASASWFLLERPVMQRVRDSIRRQKATATTPQSAPAAVTESAPAPAPQTALASETASVASPDPATS